MELENIFENVRYYLTVYIYLHIKKKYFKQRHWKFSIEKDPITFQPTRYAGKAAVEHGDVR